MARENRGQFIKPIRTEEDHKEALARIDEIFDAEESTPEGDELEVLVELVKSYEAKTVHIDFPDPISAIEFRMEQADLTPRDLIPHIGSRAKVSEVLSGKRKISMSMARALHEHLGVPADVLLKRPGAAFDPDLNGPELRRYPWKEMAKRGWVEDLADLLDHAEEMLRELEERVGGLQVMPVALLRGNGHRRINANTNLYALRGWCLRVLDIANQNAPQADFNPDIMDEDFMREVAKLSSEEGGPLRAQEHLAKHGIALVVEKHLKRTYLDGAALRVGEGRPVIGLTLRYDRIDNFWFTLMHELAHVSLHLGTGEEGAFLDDLELKESNQMEKDADELATNALIPPDIWKSWKSSPACANPSPMAVYDLSQKAEVHMAVVAGRVRYEWQNYRLLSQFVGRGEVGCLFEES